MLEKAKKTVREENLHIGSTLDEFLQEEGIFEEVKAQVMQEASDWKQKKTCASRKKSGKRGWRSA